MANWFNIFDGLPFISLFFGLILVFYWGFSFFIIYHLIRFGIGPRPKLVALIFFLGSIALFMIAYHYFSKMDLALVFENFKTTDWKFPQPELPKTSY